MAFMMKKKRYKFQVDLCLDELTEVSYSKAILFAKVRQLDGGSFTDVSRRMEVQNHCVKYSARFSFPCKMNANANSGVLETCKCRVSIRMEEKGGRHFRKLGFVDVNLAEYAGAGPSTQRYILQPYESNHRLDNSIVQLTVNITLREGDTIFQRPLTRQQPILLPGEENPRKSGIPPGPSITSGGSATPPPVSSSPMQTASGTILTASITSSERDQRPWVAAQLAAGAVTNAGRMSVTCKNDLVSKVDDLVVDPASHTRNSSTTSQVSKGSGYESQNSQPILNGPNIVHSIEKDKGPGGGTGGLPGGHSRQSSSGGESSYGRNLSQGSSDTGFFGSMEKEKRRREALGEGRVDAETVITELLEGVDLDKAVQEADDAETSGLQLFVGKDGTVTFDKNSSRLTNDYQPVVIDGPR